VIVLKSGSASHVESTGCMSEHNNANRTGSCLPEPEEFSPTQASGTHGFH